MALLQGYVVAWCALLCSGAVPAASQAGGVPALSFGPERSSDLQLRAGAGLYKHSLLLAPRARAALRPDTREPEGARRLLTTPVDLPARQRPPAPRDTALDDELRRQAEGAHYSFAASVADGINDNSHMRQETRDGLRLSGLYSYSDGFFKHTVHYIADEGGYRVLKDDVEPIGDGPRVDPWGQASVSSNVGGVQNSYTISAADIKSQQRRYSLRNQPL